MTQEAARMVGERCQRYAIDADLHWGYLHAAVKLRQLRELADWQARAARDYGYEALRLVEQAGLSALWIRRAMSAGCSTRIAVICIR
jgi:gamma-glutamylputrescine oxidase